ncbi:unannotated protein [freshwater metagenome]|uniref:Unannotated protein n=1 Tax=freshwater metagenome TaxID=449393 RepID=A0A6J7CTU0_9ZZZZ
MTDEEDHTDGLRDRLTRTGEDVLGRFAQELLDSPIVTGAIARAFEARERAAQAQEVALGALNLPSAADLERLTRRLRSVSQRLEGIEEGFDRLEERLQRSTGTGVGEQLSALSQQIAALEQSVAALATRRRAAPKTKPAAADPPSSDS